MNDLTKFQIWTLLVITFKSGGNLKICETVEVINNDIPTTDLEFVYMQRHTFINVLFADATSKCIHTVGKLVELGI